MICKELSRKQALKGCTKCAAYYLEKHYEFRLSEDERRRLEEVLKQNG